jgi:hypothetical protein
MRTDCKRSDRIRALRFSALVDQSLINRPQTYSADAGSDDADLLALARKLAQLPLLLGPVEPTLEHRVTQVALARRSHERRLSRMQVGWAFCGVAVVLLLVALLTPMGKTAVASFMDVFNLGRTEVRITPADTPAMSLATSEARSAVIRERLTLEEASDRVSFAILQPTSLPAGYQLQEVAGHTYPDLPTWVPQPFSIELVYRDNRGCELTLRHFPITLGADDQAGISGMNLTAFPIRNVLDADVNGQPGVLLQLGSGRGEPTWQELIWEQDNLILALTATDLTEAELLRVARSVR